MERAIAMMLLVPLVAACGSDRDGAARNDAALAPRTDATVDVDSQPLTPASSLPVRPATKRDTIIVDGAAEARTFDLVRSPRGFVIPFSTYVPEGFAVEFDTSAPAHRVTFAVGDVMDAGFMMMTVHPAGTTRLEVEDAVREFVVSRAPGIDESSAVSPPSWAEWAVDLSYPASIAERFAGSATIAQYGPRFLHIVELYPADIAAEIDPVLDVVLEQWRWEDTGRMLTAGTSRNP